MAWLDWKGSLATGHPEMDQQHKSIIDDLNHLHAGVEAGLEAMEERLQRLVATTQSHYAWEEEIMDRHQFPQAVAHRASHASRLTNLFELQAKCREGNGQAVKNWLQEIHTQFIWQVATEDMVLVDFLEAKEQGPTQAPLIQPG